jgi:hypothetical protein
VYEDHPERDTPEEINQMLADYGGLSPHGDPIWRLVLARNCRLRCFGQLNFLPDGLDIEDLPEGSKPTDVTPVRIEVGEHWVPRYQQDGWILERWFPASAWGPREKWEAEKDKDGRTRLLAAYPERGGYMAMPAGPWRTITEAGDLCAAIRCYNMQQRRNPVRWDLYMETQAAREGVERQKRADEYAEEIAALHRASYGPAMRTASKAAQEMRSAVAEQAAGGVNLGASEKWG